jgi:hypothetical protein
MARVFAASVLAVAGDSISSCGSASDHFKVDYITLDADADKGPRKGKPFTITASGTLDEDHTGGRVVVDAHLKALGVVDEDVQADQKYTWSPGIAGGKTQLTIGPFTFPRVAPGVFDFTGKITVENDKAEPVLCLDLALNIPKILAEELEEESEKALCAVTDSDHITNIDQTDPAVTSFDVDEAIDYVNVAVDIAVKAPVVPAVNFKVTQLPVAISPGLAKGHHVFTGIDSAAPSNDLITVTGSVGLNDKNGEQYTCITFDASESSVSV